MLYDEETQHYPAVCKCSCKQRHGLLPPRGFIDLVVDVIWVLILILVGMMLFNAAATAVLLWISLR